MYINKVKKWRIFLRVFFLHNIPFYTQANKHFIFVPLYKQATNYTCGAAVVQSILAYYGEHEKQSNLTHILQADQKKGIDC